MKSNKKNFEIIKAQNNNLSEELNQNSRMLSEEKIKFNELQKINDEYKEKFGLNNDVHKKEEEINKILEKNMEEMKNKILNKTCFSSKITFKCFSLVFIIFFFCFSFDSIARLYKETI